MAVLIRFPKVGPSVEEAMVGAWRKAEGDLVEKGEGLVELITDKATFDLESEAGGRLLRVLAPTKSTVPVNYILAVLGEPGETPPDVNEENRRLLEAHREKAQAPQWTAPQSASVAGDGVRATPSARRLAKQAGVALEAVAKRKGGGVVKDEDVREFIKARDQDVQKGRTTP